MAVWLEQAVRKRGTNMKLQVEPRFTGVHTAYETVKSLSFFHVHSN